MASVGQVYYNVIDKNSGTCESNGTIFKEDSAPDSKELVGRVGADRFTKLGIQAPPGTKAVLNLDKEIVIGATGMYEIEEVPITSLYFVRPLKYVYDEEGSEQLVKDGIIGLKAAEEKRNKELQTLNNDSKYGGVVPDWNSDEKLYKDYWTEYNRIQTNFINEYNQALRSYMQGLNGQYKLPDDSNIAAAINYDDLYNVIIDFLYE